MTLRKTGGIGSIAQRALLGSKNLSPEQLNYVNKFVTRHGHSRVNSQRGFLKGLLLGNEHSKDIMRARYMQGGLLGKGGLIMGEVAPNDEFIRSAGKLKDYLKSAPGTPHSLNRADIKNIAGGGLGLGLGAGFMIGFPALEAYHAATGSDPNYGESRRGAGVGRALGSGMGFLLTGGLGLPAGMAASYLGGKIGEGMGGVFDPASNMSQTQMSIPEQALYYPNT